MEEDNLPVEIDSPAFYTVKDPETGRVYNVPDISGSLDLLKAIQESNPKGRIPPEMKIASAALWAVLGSSNKVGAILGLESRTIRNWYHEPWWHIALREVRKAKNEEFDAHLTLLMEDTVDQLRDRVQNGETRISKDGTSRKVPVGARDLASVMAIAFDKRAILRGDPTSKVARVDVTEHLQSVAEKLEKMVGKIHQPEIHEGEFTSED